MTVDVSIIATQIMNALFAPFTVGGGAIAELIQTTFVDMLFVVEEGAVTGLNAFGITIIVFGGVTLLLSLVYLVYNLVRSKLG